jgi:hypothetical protein
MGRFLQSFSEFHIVLTDRIEQPFDGSNIQAGTIVKIQAYPILTGKVDKDWDVESGVAPYLTAFVLVQEIR